jgi:hypothetical protein
MNLFDKLNPVNKLKQKMGKVIGDKIGTGITNFLNRFYSHLEKLKSEINTTFHRDHDLIGRVLKCHLVLESYMDKTITHLNKGNWLLKKFL